MSIIFRVIRNENRKKYIEIEKNKGKKGLYVLTQT